jgi:biopolymer transport protein TolR
MGIQVGGRRAGPMSDPNVIPFIDICLVLLIIFMIVVTVLIAQMGYLSKLPPRAQTQTPPSASEQIVIRVAAPCRPGQLARCRIFINREEVPMEQLLVRIQQVMQGRSTQMIFFTADDEVNYENAMRILDIVRQGGARNIGILTEPISATTSESLGSPATVQ